MINHEQLTALNNQYSDIVKNIEKGKHELFLTGDMLKDCNLYVIAFLLHYIQKNKIDYENNIRNITEEFEYKYKNLLKENEYIASLKTGLTFNQLRDANISRIPKFKNKHGEPAHSHPLGKDWTPSQWLQAIVGELGEYANKRKKFERGDIGPEEFNKEAAKELADVQIYLDILAFQLGINLGAATTEKFNEVSDRFDCDVKLQQNYKKLDLSGTISTNYESVVPVKGKCKHVFSDYRGEIKVGDTVVCTNCNRPLTVNLI